MQRFAVAVTFLAASVSMLADGHRSDGNWWNRQTRADRLMFVVGFSDGMEFGFFLLLETKWKWAEEAAKEFDGSFTKFFRNTTTGQLADGLDQFYSDPRNRSITIPWAVWVVVNGIAGTPQEEVDRMTRLARQRAAGD